MFRPQTKLMAAILADLTTGGTRFKVSEGESSAPAIGVVLNSLMPGYSVQILPVPTVTTQTLSVSMQNAPWSGAQDYTLNLPAGAVAIDAIVSGDAAVHLTDAHGNVLATGSKDAITQATTLSSGTLSGGERLQIAGEGSGTVSVTFKDAKGNAVDPVPTPLPEGQTVQMALGQRFSLTVPEGQMAEFTLSVKEN